VTEYFATNIASQKEEVFSSKEFRDISVRAKTFNNPRDSKSISKIAEITKNIALIYVEQGQNVKAIEAINKAKQLNPNDYNLLISEANIRYKIGEVDKYKELIEKAISLQPNNVDLIYNLGVVASEINDHENAKKYYSKVLDIDPNYTNALIGSAALIINQEQSIVDEMNSLGASKADDKRFEQLKIKRNQLYLDAIPYLEKALEIAPKNIEAAKSLMSLYSAIDDSAKFKELKTKIAAIEMPEN